MEEESKTKFSMNVEFSFSFKTLEQIIGKGLHNQNSSVIIVLLKK